MPIENNWLIKKSNHVEKIKYSWIVKNILYYPSYLKTNNVIIVCTSFRGLIDRLVVGGSQLGLKGKKEKKEKKKKSYKDQV